MKKCSKKLKYSEKFTSKLLHIIPDIILILALIAALIFVLYPLLLKNETVKNIVSVFLSPLNDISYKTIYVESLGALFGTFFAIIGALFTQKLFNKRAEKRQLKEYAVMLYCAFDSAFEQMTTAFLGHCIELKKHKEAGTMEKCNYYNELRKTYAISIDNNWIENASKLSHNLNPQQIRLLYKIYGDLCSTKHTLDNKELTEEETNRVFDAFVAVYMGEERVIDILNNNGYSEDFLRPEYRSLMKKIKEIGEIETN